MFWTWCIGKNNHRQRGCKSVIAPNLFRRDFIWVNSIKERFIGQEKCLDRIMEIFFCELYLKQEESSTKGGYIYIYTHPPFANRARRYRLESVSKILN